MKLFMLYTKIKTMIKIIYTLLLLFTTQCGLAQYEPKAQGELITHENYSLDYNEEHEQANWVYYKLAPQNIAGGAKRTNSFKIDPKVSTHSASTSDYTKSGYDRGHLCPAADMSHTTVAMRESFYMSNMSPQAPALNRGGWKLLEEQVREWCLEKGELYIVVGGILESGLPTIGGNGVSIPKSYYKVIYSPQEQEMIAFVMPNEKLPLPTQSYVTSVDEVEEITGIDLFYQLEDAVEDQLEANSDLSKWKF